jgi:cytochrome c551/c552
MFDTLRQAAAAIDDESRRRLLQEQGDRLIEQIRTQLKGPDLQDIEARYAGFSEAFA